LGLIADVLERTGPNALRALVSGKPAKLKDVIPRMGMMRLPDEWLDAADKTDAGKLISDLLTASYLAAPMAFGGAASGALTRLVLRFGKAAIPVVRTHSTEIVAAITTGLVYSGLRHLAGEGRKVGESVNEELAQFADNIQAMLDVFLSQQRVIEEEGAEEPVSVPEPDTVPIPEPENIPTDLDEIPDVPDFVPSSPDTSKWQDTRPNVGGRPDAFDWNRFYSLLMAGIATGVGRELGSSLVGGDNEMYPVSGGSASGPEIVGYCKQQINDALRSGDDSGIEPVCRMLYQEALAKGSLDERIKSTVEEGSQPRFRPFTNKWPKKARERSR
jgi:hypothetical protein